MSKTIATFLLAALLILSGGVCSAKDGRISTILAVGPSWEKFTNKDGTGLYHEILDEVFALNDIKVERKYTPSGRGYDLVANGSADVMTCKAYAEPPLRLGRYPMFVNQYHAFFDRRKIGKWKGRESMNGRSLVWRLSYYRPEEFADLDVTHTELTSGARALGMVLLRRTDFYVDDINFIKDSIARNMVPYNPNEFDIRPVGERSYHPVFKNSKRGRVLKAMYEKGVARLHREGKLKPIFDKWGFRYPDYDSY